MPDIEVYLFRDHTGETYERITLQISDRIQRHLKYSDRKVWASVLAGLDAYARNQNEDT